MKIIFKRNEIIEGVGIVGHALTSTSLPILSHILMVAGGDSVRLTATNLETTIQCVVPAQVEEGGEICISGEKFSSIVRQLSPLPVRFKTEETRVAIRCGRAKFNLLGLPATEFPEYPQPGEIDFSLPESDLKQMIQKTIFAVSTDETRRSLNGIYLEGKEEILRMISTDGRRLALVSTSLPSISSPTEVLIPLKGAQQLLRILGDGGEVKIGISENQVFFHTPRTLLISQLISAKFPDYQQVIPHKSNTVILVDRLKLLSAIRRCSILSEEKSHLLRFKLKDDLLSLTGSEPELGDAYEEVSVESEGKKELEVGFNSAYLVEALKVISEEKVELELIDSASPGVLRGEKEKSYLYVLMPIRIEEISEEDSSSSISPEDKKEDI